MGLHALSRGQIHFQRIPHRRVDREGLLRSYHHLESSICAGGVRRAVWGIRSEGDGYHEDEVLRQTDSWDPSAVEFQEERYQAKYGTCLKRLNLYGTAGRGRSPRHLVRWRRTCYWSEAALQASAQWSLLY